MAYNKDNFNQRIKEAVKVTKMYYEPGRQDRSHTWIWQTHIHDTFHVCYATYMSWLRSDPEYMAYWKRLLEEYKSDLKEQQAERARNPRRKRRRQTSAADMV